MSRLDIIRSMNDEELISSLENTSERNLLVEDVRKTVLVAILTLVRIATRE